MTRNTSLPKFDMARFMVAGLSVLLFVASSPRALERAGQGGLAAPAPRTGEARQAVKPAAETCLLIQRGVGGDVADATISSATPAKNRGGTKTIGVNNTAGGVRDAALLRFNLSSVPRGASITSAKATLTLVQYGGVRARAHRITAPWAEHTVTWKSFHGAFVLATEATFPGTKTASIDLQTLVQGWVNGTIENNGILVEREPSGSDVFASSEGSASERPSLSVCYRMISAPSCITLAPQYCIDGLCQEYCTGTACYSPTSPISQAMCGCGAALGLNPACGVGTCAGTQYCPGTGGGCGQSLCFPSSSPVSQMLCGGNIPHPTLKPSSTTTISGTPISTIPSSSSTVVSNAVASGSYCITHSCGSNRGSGYLQTNTVIRHCDKTFVTWQQYDPSQSGYYKSPIHGQYTDWVGTNQTNQLGTSTWGAVALPDPSTVDPSSYPMGSDPMDDHGQPSLIADNSGYLHLFYGPHNQPLLEAVSSSPWLATPNFTATKNPPSQPGSSLKATTTYSSVVRDPTGLFHMVTREYDGLPTLMYTNGTPSSTGTVWHNSITLAQIPAIYANYGGVITVDQAGSLHVAFHMYPENASLASDQQAAIKWEYLRSDDQGITWRYDNNTQATLPIVTTSPRFVDNDPHADMRVNNIALDPSGWPWVSVLYLDNPTPSNYSLTNAPVRDTYLWHETATGQWSKIGLSALVNPLHVLPCYRRVVSFASITFDAQGVLYVAAQTVRQFGSTLCDSTDYAWFTGASTQVVMLVSSDLGNTFQLYFVTPPSTAQTPQWLANIERPTTPLPIPVPALLYTSGTDNTSTFDGLPNKATDIVFTSFYKQ